MESIKSSRFISVHTLANQFEADLLKGALESEEIPVFVRSFHDTAYDGIYIPQKGWGRLMVPEENVEEAERIITEILADIEKGTARYENPENIDSSYWERLASADPEKIAARAKVTYDKNQVAYRVPFLNEEVLCFPKIQQILPAAPESILSFSFQFYLVILTYLLEAKPIEPSGELVNEKGLRGGQFFFRGPHKLRTSPLEGKFGRDREGFLAAGKRLGGVEIDLGDGAVRLWPLPKIPLVYVLWLEDGEFPAQVVLNFDSTIAEHFPPDVVWALVNVVSELFLK